MHRRITYRRKASFALCIATFFMYMIICFTKINYSASIASIVAEGMFTKTEAGIISAVFYLVYGVGQLFGGKLTDRMSPYTSPLIGIVGCIVANAALCFTNDFWAVLIIWGLSGAAQFGVWPGASRIIADVLIPEHKQRGSALICCALAVGGFFSYSFASVVLEHFGWSGIFALNAGLLTALLGVWIIVSWLVPKALVINRRRHVVAEEYKEIQFIPLFLASGLFIGVFFSFCQTMLDNGAKTWIPTMLNEIYHITPTFAGVLTGAMYLINVVGVLFLSGIYRKIKNEFRIDRLVFSVASGLLTVLQFIGSIPLWLVIICFVGSTTLMYSLGNVNVRIAMRFSKYGRSATVSGIWNAVASFGVVVASYAYGALSENFGWSAVTVVWLVLAIVAIALSFPCAIMWKKFTKNP